MRVTRRSWLAGAAAAVWPYGVLRRTVVFRSGEEGYASFRIPALAVSSAGTLLAFCEGRRFSASDTGDIDLMLKRSTDGGRSWGPLQLVADHGEDTIGNPCPVVERDSRVIWLPLTGNGGKITQAQILRGEGTRPMYMSSSRDDGKTWSKPADISADVADPSWTWCAAGPGNAIQLKSGRLLVPCDFAAPGSQSEYAWVMYSDDRGKSWKRGGIAADGMGEATVVELADGSLLMNARTGTAAGCRCTARSRDGGMSWQGVRLETCLTEPRGGCQGSMIRYTRQPEHSRNRLLFSNPAGARRYNLTVRISYDEGQTWRRSRVLWEGPSAYSSLAVLPDRSIGCLYENGEERPSERLTFACFDLAWLSGGEDAL